MDYSDFSKKYFCKQIWFNIYLLVNKVSYLVTSSPGRAVACTDFAVTDGPWPVRPDDTPSWDTIECPTVAFSFVCKEQISLCFQRSREHIYYGSLTVHTFRGVVLFTLNSYIGELFPQICCDSSKAAHSLYHSPYNTCYLCFKKAQ